MMICPSSYYRMSSSVCFGCINLVDSMLKFQVEKAQLIPLDHPQTLIHKLVIITNTQELQII